MAREKASSSNVGCVFSVLGKHLLALEDNEVAVGKKEIFLLCRNLFMLPGWFGMLVMLLCLEVTLSLFTPAKSLTFPLQRLRCMASSATSLVYTVNSTGPPLPLSISVVFLCYTPPLQSLSTLQKILLWAHDDTLASITVLSARCSCKVWQRGTFISQVTTQIGIILIQELGS
ncbi:hypothetical protein ACOSQ2_001581 [Xanthoceras sorbifolium]